VPNSLSRLLIIVCKFSKSVTEALQAPFRSGDINLCLKVLILAYYNTTNCYVLLTVLLSIIVDNDQLDTHLLYFTIRLL